MPKSLSRRGAITLLLCLACSPENAPTPPAPTPTPTPTPTASTLHVEISPRALLLTARGQRHSLAARVVDAQGATVPGASFAWSSSNPALVSVDASGVIETLGELGSAQISATASGVRAEILVVVARPVAGALLVTDGQLLDGPRLLGIGPLAIGSRLQATLKGPSVPTVGAVVLGTEGKSLAGRVVSASTSSAGVVVELEVVPLIDLFDALEVAASFDLSEAPVVLESDAAPLARVPQADGGSLDRFAVTPGAVEPGTFKLGPLTCKSSGALTLSGSAVDFKLEQSLKADLSLSRGLGREIDLLQLKIEGTEKATLSGGVTLSLALAGSVKCELKGKSIPIPVGGVLALFITPAVPLGLGMDLTASLNLANVSFRLEGSVEATLRAGFEYTRATGFTDLSRFDVTKNFAPQWAVPNQSDFFLTAGLDLFVLSGLDIEVLGGAESFGVLDARVGYRADLNLSFPTFQAADPARASSYGLKLFGQLGLGAGVAKVFELIEGGPKSFSPSAETQVSLSRSPTGTFNVNRTRVQPGEAVTFRVDLDPGSLNFPRDVYNVSEVQIWARSDKDPVLKVFRALPVAVADRSFEATWTPTARDVGQYSFFAFVDTRLVPYPPLEIDTNTERKLSVGTATKQWSGKVTYTIASNVSIPNSGSGPDGSSFSETTTITETGGGSYDLVPGSQEGTLKYASPMADYHFRQTFNRTDVNYLQTSDGPCTINGTTADEDTLDGTTNESQQFAVFQLSGDRTRYSLTIGTLDGAATGTARRSSRTQVSGPTGLCPLPINQNSTNPTSGGFPGHGFLIDRPLDPAHLDLIEGSEVYNETVGGNLPRKYTITWRLVAQ